MVEQPARLVLDPNIRWRRQKQGGILLNTCTSEVFRLNEAAMRMWLLLLEGNAPQDVIGEIAQETGAETALVQADLEGFLSLMLSAGVLRPSGPDDELTGGNKWP
jgi:hypothetical protein